MLFVSLSLLCHYVEELRNVSGEFTVFAPTNRAFEEECRRLDMTEEEFLGSPDLSHMVGRCKLDPSLKAPRFSIFQRFNLMKRGLLST